MEFLLFYGHDVDLTGIMRIPQRGKAFQFPEAQGPIKGVGAVVFGIAALPHGFDLQEFIAQALGPGLQSLP